MDEPLRIFVAGPYCAYNCDPHLATQVTQRNLDTAIWIANRIIDRGHYAFVPHLTHYLHIHNSCRVDRKDWYCEYDNTFLDLWANALFLIAPSPGSNKELERAVQRGYLIFNHVDDIPKSHSANRFSEASTMVIK